MTIKPYFPYLEAEILPLYKSVGWCNYYDHPNMLQQAFANSLCILGAYDAGKLIGILRAVGDGHSIVFIQDILIFPEYQRKGIGTKLMNALMDRYPDVYQMELATDITEKTCSFYQALGFEPMDKLGCCGFVRINPNM